MTRAEGALAAAAATRTQERRNIQTIAALEASARARASRVDRAIDAIAAVSAHPAFIVIHVLWFAAWLDYNRGPRSFDPFPFSLLTLVVSLEAILLSAFILIAQNRMTAEADRRAHLDLQINLLAEQELSAILRILCKLSAATGVDVSDEPALAEFQTETDVQSIVDIIEEGRKQDSPTPGTVEPPCPDATGER